jgi:hypothetical protein
MHSIYRYRQGVVLAGVLYFHRISDFWMTGVSKKNLLVFQKICGKRALQNVVIVTNMWGDVDPRIGNTREAELMKDFKPVLDGGAKMTRHNETLSSAQRIIQLFFKKYSHLPLRIQKELVDEGKNVYDTDANRELKWGLTARLDTRGSQEMVILFVSHCIPLGHVCYLRASHI